MRQIPNSFSVEILNINPVNEYISECDIKVFYQGKNRNGSFISQPVGEAIAQSLPNTPIVGFVREDGSDFGSHEKQLVIDENGVKFTSKTFPYGVVSESHPISWQQFQDYDGAIRTYLVCHGYLWTGRYPEIYDLIQKDKGQSMEFFPESIEGTWAKLNNETDETFIFSKASFSALCILGDDVEPCFEGAAVTTKSNFALDEKENAEFKENFAKFMFELKETLNTKEGGNIELEVNTTTSNVDEVTDIEEVTTEFAQTETEVAEAEEVTVENTFSNEEFEALNEKYTNLESTYNELNDTYTALQADYEAVKNDFAALETKYNEMTSQFEALRAKETERVNAEKDELFSKFSMLNEDVLSALKEQKDTFSVEQLDEKLSALAFKAGVNFSLDTDNIVIPIVDDPAPQIKDEWLQAVANNKNKE